MVNVKKNSKSCHCVIIKSLGIFFEKEQSDFFNEKK